ncbi:MAG TPA: isoprenyl transferase [Prolixibacteraceae bacterium]|nr:isoprenyl transferase [Prolixibacteraceae bacterium]HPS12992.1 isoprenyl transferase [Prolixibacteraceae bacterium]
MSYKEQIDPGKIPLHVAIIMDGNGRWAAQRGNDRIFGHQHGVDAVRSSIKAAAEVGVKYLTLYAFSTENWSRPKREVDALMSLMVNVIKSESDDLLKNNVRLIVIGDRDSLPAKLQKEVEKLIEKLGKNTGLTVVMALSYSSRWEIINAVKLIANDVKKGKIDPDNISQELFPDYLSTAKIPDPELMIRTSGEKRLSNFLLWQLAYAELYFTTKLWPDFSEEDFWEAIFNYQQRERRFGMTSEQLKKPNSK